jgi:DNA-binding NtrC family response regulator
MALVITDLKMPGMDGMDLLTQISANHPQIPVVMITAHGTIATAVEALKKGHSIILPNLSTLMT